jgi:protein TonB
MRGLHNLSYQRNTVYGLTIAMLFHLSLIATYYLTNSLKSEPRIPQRKEGLTWTSPPIIPYNFGTGYKVTTPESKPTFGVPIPVPDLEISPEKTIATQQEVNNYDNRILTDQFGDGNVPIITNEVIPEEVEPEANIFIPFEVEPKLIKQVAPEYPDIARRAGVEGTVWVNCLVGKDGRVKKAIVMKSDAEIFNEPAIQAALQWLFTPALMNNGPVTVWAAVPFKFQLNK